MRGILSLTGKPSQTPNLQTTFPPLCNLVDSLSHLPVDLGLSENRVYSQWNSHLIGTMISKTIGYNGVHNIFRHTLLQIVGECWRMASISNPRGWEKNHSPIMDKVPIFRHTHFRRTRSSPCAVFSRCSSSFPSLWCAVAWGAAQKKSARSASLHFDDTWFGPYGHRNRGL